FGPDNYLYVTGPTTSSFDAIHRITTSGEVETFYRGLGRPQGMAFDSEGRFYVAASYQGRRGIAVFDGKDSPETFLSGSGIVGLSFTPSLNLSVATQNSLYRVDVDRGGRPLP